MPRIERGDLQKLKRRELVKDWIAGWGDPPGFLSGPTGWRQRGSDARAT